MKAKWSIKKKSLSPVVLAKKTPKRPNDQSPKRLNDQTTNPPND